MTTEATRPPAAILADVVHQKGKQAKLGRKLRTNRDRNWLLAVILNSAAKVADGAPLNDLDQVVADAFAKQGLSAELAEHGRAYTSMPAATKAELFPGRFGALAPHADYSLTDLKGDLPQIERTVLAMPNAVDVDVAGVHAGTVARAAMPRPGRRVAAEYAGELLRAVEPDVAAAGATVGAADGAPDGPPTDPFRIKATSFHCTDETGADWLGSDEPYWIFGAVGNGVTITTRSKVFEDIDSGDNGTFADSEGWIWGLDQTPQPLPDGEIGIMIQLWEHDSGNPDKTKATVAAAFAIAAGVLAATGVAAWIAAIVSGVGAATQWLLGFMDDDHIADQNFVFTRQTLLSQASKAGSSFSVNRRFTDGDGDYNATVTVTHMAPVTPPPVLHRPPVDVGGVLSHGGVLSPS